MSLISLQKVLRAPVEIVVALMVFIAPAAAITISNGETAVVNGDDYSDVLAHLRIKRSLEPVSFFLDIYSDWDAEEAFFLNADSDTYPSAPFTVLPCDNCGTDRPPLTLQFVYDPSVYMCPDEGELNNDSCVIVVDMETYFRADGFEYIFEGMSFIEVTTQIPLPLSVPLLSGALVSLYGLKRRSRTSRLTNPYV